MSAAAELVIVVVLSLMISGVIYFFQKRQEKKGGFFFFESNEYDRRILQLKSELEESHRNCEKKIEELERRIDFLLEVLTVRDQPDMRGTRIPSSGMILLLSQIGVYGTALKMSGLTVSVVDTGSLVSTLSLLPRSPETGDYSLVIAVLDDWGSIDETSIMQIPDVSGRIFCLVGLGSDRVASFLGKRSRGAVAIGATALKDGERDSVVDGNLAAFCAVFASSIIKHGVSVERAFTSARSSASEWVAERARLYRDSGT